MRISIVTVSFNQAAFVERTIQSVLTQGYDDLEYIIVDPGSTDGSREVIKRYSSNLATTILEPDKGAADGLNKGFVLATGDIFGFLNSDDTLLPGALEKVAAHLKSHPNIDVVSGNAHVIDEHDRVLRKTFTDRFSLRDAAYRISSVIQPSTFFRREAFQGTRGFNPINRCCWDGELWVDMAEQGARFGCINEFLSCYRLHGQSITGTGKLAGLYAEYSERVFRRVIGRPKRPGDELIRQALRARRLLVNWRDAAERLMRGPIFGRCTVSEKLPV